MLTGYHEWPRFDRTRAGNPLWNLYACAQDEWIMLGIIDSTRHWPEFCEVIGQPGLLEDPAACPFRGPLRDTTLH